MHSMIIQFSLSPIYEDDYMTEDDFIDNGFVGWIADYVNSDIDRDDYIQWFLDFVEPYGIEYNSEDQSVIFLPGFKRKYFEERLQKLKDYVQNLSIESFASDIFVSSDIQKLVEDEFGFYVYEDGDLMPFDYFVRTLSEGQKYFIGGVLDYHF